MKLKRFVAPTTREAMQQIKNVFGAEAVILSSHSVDNGVEIVAAIDFDETILTQAAAIEEVKSENRYSASAAPRSPMDDMRQEISTLRGMLEAQLKAPLGNTSPLHHVLTQKLSASGVSLTTCASLMQRINPSLNQKQAFESAMSQLADAITVHDKSSIEDGGIYAFLGATGVGKTTTLAKVAARCVLRFGPESLGLITMDTYRIAAQEQLLVYGKILGVDVNVAEDEVALSRAIQQLSDKKLILIDTPGFSPKDPRVAEQMTQLTTHLHSITSVLVLPATSHYQVLMDAIQCYQASRFSQCIVTKLDESHAIGGIISALVETGLPVSYLTHGQRVPEDIKIATKYQFTEQLIKQELNLTSKDLFSCEVTQDIVRGLYVDG